MTDIATKVWNATLLPGTEDDDSSAAEYLSHISEVLQAVYDDKVYQDLTYDLTKYDTIQKALELKAEVYEVDLDTLPSHYKDWLATAKSLLQQLLNKP